MLLLLPLLLELAIIVFYLVAGWKLYTKAGQPGWGVIIPIYNVYLWVKIAGRPGWWTLLFFIPLANLIVGILTAIDVAKAFGKDVVFGVLLLFFLGFIGLPMLAYGSAVYTKPATAS